MPMALTLCGVFPAHWHWQYHATGNAVIPLHDQWMQDVLTLLKRDHEEHPAVQHLQLQEEVRRCGVVAARSGLVDDEVLNKLVACPDDFVLVLTEAEDNTLDLEPVKISDLSRVSASCSASGENARVTLTVPGVYVAWSPSLDSYVGAFNTVKIGKTTNLVARMRSLSTAAPEEFIPLLFVPMDSEELALQLERDVLEICKGARIPHRWGEGALSELVCHRPRLVLDQIKAVLNNQQLRGLNSSLETCHVVTREQSTSAAPSNTTVPDDGGSGSSGIAACSQNADWLRDNQWVRAKDEQRRQVEMYLLRHATDDYRVCGVPKSWLRDFLKLYWRSQLQVGREWTVENFVNLIPKRPQAKHLVNWEKCDSIMKTALKQFIEKQVGYLEEKATKPPQTVGQRREKTSGKREKTSHSTDGTVGGPNHDDCWLNDIFSQDAVHAVRGVKCSKASAEEYSLFLARFLSRVANWGRTGTVTATLHGWDKKTNQWGTSVVSHIVPLVSSKTLLDSLYEQRETVKARMSKAFSDGEATSSLYEGISSRKGTLSAAWNRIVVLTETVKVEQEVQEFLNDIKQYLPRFDRDAGGGIKQSRVPPFSR